MIRHLAGEAQGAGGLFEGEDAAGAIAPAGRLREPRQPRPVQHQRRLFRPQRPSGRGWPNRYGGNPLGAEDSWRRRFAIFLSGDIAQFFGGVAAGRLSLLTTIRDLPRPAL